MKFERFFFNYKKLNSRGKNEKIHYIFKPFVNL